MVDLPDEKIGCHRTGFEKKCRQLVCEGICSRWIHLEGNHPVTGAFFTKADCVDNWGPTLWLDLSKKMQNGFDGNQAATESFRNVMVQLQYPELYEQMKASPKLINDKGV